MLLVVIGVATAARSASATDVFARELSTDRPDTTESPYTVEAGRWQVEGEVLRWSRDSADGVRVETSVLGAANIKCGLSASSDLQIVVEPWVRIRTTGGGASETVRGAGDTTVRLKLNLAGNDGRGLACGVMPFVKLPTAASAVGNGRIEGGLIVPLAGELGGGWDFGVMAEFDAVRNEANSGYTMGVLTTATVAREIAPGVGAFFEIASEAQHVRARTWAVSFNTGLTFATSANTQLDVGTNLALTSAAENRAFFCGVSTRW